MMAVFFLSRAFAKVVATAHGLRRQSAGRQASRTGPIWQQKLVVCSRDRMLANPPRRVAALYQHKAILIIELINHRPLVAEHSHRSVRQPLLQLRAPAHTLLVDSSLIVSTVSDDESRRDGAAAHEHAYYLSVHERAPLEQRARFDSIYPALVD
ncbi:hypothetical protein HDK90DRAFT_96515 [Phyllosticta capitalensis]|uniref:Secreted protein n=1 Tax=Phyllosticta capitalensis TaxID=121624 RepID=A0ABR1YD03_9PEZI